MNAPQPDLVAGIRAGDRRAIAQAITRIENAAPGAGDLVRALLPLRGHALVLGITGAPGAGKSTLIHALLGELLQRGQRIAVVAVDPSSPITGGAVLGDRVRMGEHGAHERVFIRSVSSRGHVGGLSRATAAIVDVFDAARFDVVIVETVGAGQSEVEIASLADTRVVVCPPGLGDDVQAIKAGILEIADVFVVSKGDLPAADATVRDLKDMLRLRHPDRREIPVLRTVATRSEGIAAVIDAALAHGVGTGRGKRSARLAHDAHEGASASAHVALLAAKDAFAQHLGIELVDSGPGRATVRMTVRGEHLNFNGTCHGGALFALADTAFGLASNSHGAVAAGIDAHVTYHVAARLGDVLTAAATEASRTRRIAVYRIDVTGSDAALIAGFTGTVYVSSRAHSSIEGART
jgi:LAO/AO transport system ATPase/phenylacetic acid degradation protein PaaD